MVDDTGEDVLAPWLERRYPAVRCHGRPANGGFAAALASGAEAAKHGLIFSMNSDVVVRPGFLDPLVACLDDPKVFAVSPRVLLNGAEDRIESLVHFRLRRGMVEVAQPALEAPPERGAFELQPVAFAVGGTMLLRREEFLEAGGFDPIYAPFYWEDIDLAWSAWRRGRVVLYQPASVVEHHHRGTIGSTGRPEWFRAAIERNRLLFQWKHLDGELLEQHLAALLRWIVDAHLAEQREELIWLNLAFDRMRQVLATREAQPPSQDDFATLLGRTGRG